MPKKFLVQKDEMLKWYQKMQTELSFRLASVEERRIWINYKIKSDEIYKKVAKKRYNYPKKGLEDCLVYQNGDRQVHIWTSYVPQEGRMRDSDYVWLYVLDSRYPLKPSLFTIPLRRTTNILENTYKRAKALKNLVDNWQMCDLHGVALKIILVRGQEMHKSAYVCPKGGFHRDIPRWIYTGMEVADREILEKSFSAYEKYSNKEKDKGNIRVPQRVLRANQTSRSGYDKMLNFINPKKIYLDPEPNSFYNDGDHLE